MHFKQLADAFRAFRRDNATRFGAALAFYIALSIAPIAIIAIAVVAMIFGRHAAEGVIFHQIAGTLGPATQSAIEQMVKDATRPKVGVLATALGTLTLLSGLIGIYAQIDDALNTIWKVERAPRGRLRLLARVRAATLVLGTGCLMLIIVAADGAIAITGKYAGHHLLGGEPLWQSVQLIVSGLVLTALFAVMFRFLPDVRVAWHDSLPGAAFTASLFVIGKFGLGLYLGKAAVGSSYGAAGSLVVVLLWAYWSAQIFFFGLEFTHVYAAREE
jgi:membrane protein